MNIKVIAIVTPTFSYHSREKLLYFASKRGKSVSGNQSK